MDYKQKLKALESCGIRLHRVAQLAGINSSTLYKQLNGINDEFKIQTQDKPFYYAILTD